jgi:hypothetical protein
MDTELLITAFFSRIRHPEEAWFSTAPKKNDSECMWYNNDLGIRRQLEAMVQGIYAWYKGCNAFESFPENIKSLCSL